jgi:hypothetical protein
VKANFHSDRSARSSASKLVSPKPQTQTDARKDGSTGTKQVVEEIERHRSFGTTTARQFLIGRTSKGKENGKASLCVCVERWGKAFCPDPVIFPF